MASLARYDGHMRTLLILLGLIAMLLGQPAARAEPPRVVETSIPHGISIVGGGETFPLNGVPS